MFVVLLVALLAGGAAAQPSPFYPRDGASNQAWGAVNQNFQDITGANRDKLVPVVNDVDCSVSGGALTGATQKGGYIYGGSCSPIVTANTQTTFVSSVTFLSSVTFSGSAIFSSTVTFNGLTTYAAGSTVTFNNIAPSTPTANSLYQGMFPAVVVSFAGADGSINFDINVTSVTRNNTGQYIISFARPFASSTAYGCQQSIEWTADTTIASAVFAGTAGQGFAAAIKNTRSIGMNTFITGGTNTDFTNVTVTCYGAQ